MERRLEHFIQRRLQSLYRREPVDEAIELEKQFVLRLFHHNSEP
jgi:hypothetical protein